MLRGLLRRVAVLHRDQPSRGDPQQVRLDARTTAEKTCVARVRRHGAMVVSGYALTFGPALAPAGRLGDGLVRPHVPDHSHPSERRLIREGSRAAWAGTVVGGSPRWARRIRPCR